MSLYFDDFSFGIMDYSGKIIHKLLKHDKPRKADAKAMICFYDFYSIRDTIVFWEYIFDEVYGLSPNLELSPRWILELGESSVPREAFKNRTTLDKSIKSGKLVITDFIESKNHIYISALKNRRRQLYIYEKANGKLNNVNYYNGTFYGIFNDIDFGAGFWPQYAINDSLLACALDPEKCIQMSLRKSRMDSITDPLFKKILRNQSLKSNHVIMKILLHENK